MIVDTSVLIALLREEPATARFVPILAREYDRLAMSVANYVEAGIVIDRLSDDILSERLDHLIQHFGIAVVPVDVHQAYLARQAYRRFGKGRHPAALNYGDCFAYALAKARGQALLFKGEDFSKTDVQIASRPDD